MWYTITKSLHTSRPVHMLFLLRNARDKGSLFRERTLAWQIESPYVTYNSKYAVTVREKPIRYETLLSDIPKEYPTSHWYFLGVHTSLYFLVIHMNLKASVYTKKIQVTSWIINGWPREKALYISFITHDIRTAHDGKVGCNTVEVKNNTLMYPDWLYFYGLL